MQFIHAHQNVEAQKNILPSSSSEAMEARAHQRAERRKEIEELKRKREEEKLVRNQGVVLSTIGSTWEVSEKHKNATLQAELKAAEEQRQLEKDEEKRKAAEKKKEEKRQEREVRRVSYLVNIHKHMSRNTRGHLKSQTERRAAGPYSH